MRSSEDFKSVFYRNYRSTHNRHLYGPVSLVRIESNFPAWNYYYATHLPKYKEARILDLGCGDGAFVHYLQRQGYSQAEGIDLSHEQIAEGQNIGIKNIQVADAFNYLQTISKPFDMIVARDLIEHFTRQEAFDLITLIQRCLSKDGRFMMQVPNGQGLYYTSIFYGDYTHEMAYTTTSVRQLFLNTGFREIHCYPTGPVPHSWKGKIRTFLWRWKVMTLRFWKMVETGNPDGIFTSNLIAVGDK